MLCVKIICTIGPASREHDVMVGMIRAGMNVARLNLSHGTHEYHAETIRRIRNICQELDRSIAILADLQGPKLRTGIMQEEGVALKAGEELILTTEEIIGEPGRVPIQYKELPERVKPGEHILLDDGLLELEVLDASQTDIRTRVIIGGLLKDKKGMNLPNASLDIPALTEKDREDVKFVLEHQVDWLALSFVRTAAEIEDLRSIVLNRAAYGRTIPIIAKIEKPEAVENITEIIEASDGIMVARGDLGIETSPEAVPMVQKMIINQCASMGKPVITATQMLDSMIRNPRPTRAEASDVANAVLDGSDAIMLSGETATGKYPIESIQTMVKIAEEAERVRLLTQPEALNLHRAIRTIAGAVSHATVMTARDIQAAAIVAPTVSGSTAKLLARFRPSVPIVAVTPSPMVQRQLALFWGVQPLLSRRQNTTDGVVEDAIQIAHRRGYVDQGDTVVVTGGVVGSVPGVTNLMTVRRIARILVSGTGLNQNRMIGRVLRLEAPCDCDSASVSSEDILAVDHTDRSFIEVLRRSGGLITREPGPESHAALAAIELGIPAVIGAEGNWDELTTGRRITLDPVSGNVYELTA